MRWLLMLAMLPAGLLMLFTIVHSMHMYRMHSLARLPGTRRWYIFLIGLELASCVASVLMLGTLIFNFIRSD